jgi:hypothetical protein
MPSSPLTPFSPSEIAGIHTTALPPLAWDTPEFLNLFKSYREGNAWDEKPVLPEAHAQYSGQYSEFYRNNGYIGKPAPDASQLIDNAIHPIFAKANWMAGYQFFDEWYDLVKPALALASKLITDPHMLLWWLHVRHGSPTFLNGCVGIKEDPENIPSDALEAIARDFEKIAGSVKFTFLCHDDMKGAVARYSTNVHGLRRTFENAAESRGYSRPKGMWYNQWSAAEQDTILLHEQYYHIPFEEDRYESGQQLAHHFQLAATLVHELGHLAVQTWRSEISRFNEPLAHADDGFPEAGNSWENFAFGGHLSEEGNGGPPIRAEFDHVYPAQNWSALPITAPVPVDWTARWFLQSTWSNVAELHESLKLPTIRRQQDIYLVMRFRNTRLKNVLHLRELKDWTVSDVDMNNGINIIPDDEDHPASRRRRDSCSEFEITTRSSSIRTRHAARHGDLISAYETTLASGPKQSGRKSPAIWLPRTPAFLLVPHTHVLPIFANDAQAGARTMRAAQVWV